MIKSKAYGPKLMCQTTYKRSLLHQQICKSKNESEEYQVFNFHFTYSWHNYLNDNASYFKKIKITWVAYVITWPHIPKNLLLKSSEDNDVLREDSKQLIFINVSSKLSYWYKKDKLRTIDVGSSKSSFILTSLNYWTLHNHTYLYIRTKITGDVLCDWGWSVLCDMTSESSLYILLKLYNNYIINFKLFVWKLLNYSVA